MVTQKFLLAGNATFTFSNGKGKHFTFKVKKNKHKENYFFVGVCSAYVEYSYIGFFVATDSAHKLIRGKKGARASAQSVKVFNWALKIILGSEDLPEGYEIQHSGRCGKCNRELTEPESLEIGLGPTCRKQ